MSANSIAVSRVALASVWLHVYLSIAVLAVTCTLPLALRRAVVFRRLRALIRLT